MEPPLLQHIGITPAHQQLVLPRAEAGAAPARQLRLLRGPAELVELHDAAIGQVLQLGAARRRHEGEKARDLGKFERGNREGAVARGEPPDGVEEIALACVVDQRDRRLQGAVESVEPRVGRDLDQPVHRDAWHRPQRPRLPGFGITGGEQKVEKIGAGCRSLPLSSSRNDRVDGGGPGPLETAATAQGKPE